MRLVPPPSRGPVFCCASLLRSPSVSLVVVRPPRRLPLLLSRWFIARLILRRRCGSSRAPLRGFFLILRAPTRNSGAARSYSRSPAISRLSVSRHGWTGRSSSGWITGRSLRRAAGNERREMGSQHYSSKILMHHSEIMYISRVLACRSSENSPRSWIADIRVRIEGTIEKSRASQSRDFLPYLFYWYLLLPVLKPGLFRGHARGCFLRVYELL